MKKWILVSLIALAFVPAFAANYDVYVDTAEVGDQFVMQIGPASADTVTFNILNDGSAITAASYACSLQLFPSDSKDAAKIVTIAGTESASKAVFDMSSLKSHSGMSGYKVVLLVGTTYKAEGKLVIDATPKAVQGNPAAVLKFGAVVPAYQTDTNATINTTLYAPAFLFQKLLGTGSNTIHEAIGLTTNDWVEVTR